jgi:1-phosphofructokinase family hexose kinase
MSKIITVTLNPAIDHIIYIDKFKAGEVIRSKQSILIAAGKGINAARTVSCLQKEVIPFCFVGKNEAYLYRQLKSKYFRLYLFTVKGNTRSNITLIDSDDRLVTHLQTSGFVLNEVLLRPFEQQLENMISSGDVLVLSGSVAEGIPDDYYKRLVMAGNRKGCRVVLDSSGIKLKKGIEALPWVIKPNIHELRELSGNQVRSISEIVGESRKINKQGVEFVFISRGAKGVILTRKGIPGYWTANVKLPSEKHDGDEIGCGDAMIGGISYSLSDNYGTEDILKMAVACGAANLLSKGPGICKLSDVKNLFRQVDIKYHR